MCRRRGPRGLPVAACGCVQVHHARAANSVFVVASCDRERPASLDRTGLTSHMNGDSRKGIILSWRSN